MASRYVRATACACAQLATANSAILRLTKELAWAEEVLRALDGLRAGARGFHDRVFANEMDVAVAAARQVRPPQARLVYDVQVLFQGT